MSGVKLLTLCQLSNARLLTLQNNHTFRQQNDEGVSWGAYDKSRQSRCQLVDNCCQSAGARVIELT